MCLCICVLCTCRCGHAASSVGSSSSGSNSAPVGLDDGGNVLNIFTENCRGKNRKVSQFNNLMKIQRHSSQHQGFMIPSFTDTDINYRFKQCIWLYKIYKHVKMESLDNNKRCQIPSKSGIQRLRKRQKKWSIWLHLFNMQSVIYLISISVEFTRLIKANERKSK